MSGEDLSQQLFHAFAGDGGDPFFAMIHQASLSIGAIVAQGNLMTTPTPALITAPTFTPIAPPTDNHPTFTTMRINNYNPHHYL